MRGETNHRLGTLWHHGIILRQTFVEQLVLSIASQLRGRCTCLLPLLLTCNLCLSGCGSLLTESGAAGAGVASASIAGAVTKDAAVTSGIGLGVSAAALAGVKAIRKRVHKTEQDSIAAAAGPLHVGETAQWSSGHYKVSIERNEHGELTVSRVIRAGDLDCKEIIFSVDAAKKGQPARSFYTTIICRDGHVWRWATAEPATERWGALQ